MSEVYIVKETLTYSDGTEKVVHFNRMGEKVEGEAEMLAQDVAPEAPVEAEGAAESTDEVAPSAEEGAPVAPEAEVVSAPEVQA